MWLDCASSSGTFISMLPFFQRGESIEPSWTGSVVHVAFKLAPVRFTASRVAPTPHQLLAHALLYGLRNSRLILVVFLQGFAPIKCTRTTDPALTF